MSGDRGQWLPHAHGGHLMLPDRHYWMLAGIRTRVFRRSATGALPHTRLARQRELAIWLTMFAGARTLIWVTAMTLIIAHWAGAGGEFLHWFTSLSGSIIFVTFISFYCNASTDSANLSASLAALYAADAHAATVTAGTETAGDIAGLEDDIARLADLQPGREAARLAMSIRARLPGAPPAPVSREAGERLHQPGSGQAMEPGE